MPQMTGTEIRTIHVYASQLLGIDIPRQDVAVLKMVRCEHCHGKGRVPNCLQRRAAGLRREN